MQIATDPDFPILRQIAEALSSDEAQNAQAQEAAAMIREAGKVIFIFEKNILPVQSAAVIATIAKTSVAGIIQLLPGANSQGLSDLGVRPGEELLKLIADGSIRAIFTFGDTLEGVNLDNIEFLAVQNVYMSKASELADVVLPQFAPAEISGTYTSADGKTQQLTPAVTSPVKDCDGNTWDNITQIMHLKD